MTITFTESVPVERTMVFDAVYEEELQFEQTDKADLISRCLRLFMFVDGKLAGETYGISPGLLYSETGEEIEDCDKDDYDSCYVYSTTILPEFQGKGLGKILKAAFLGMARACGYGDIIGHATSPAMVEINKQFGAQFDPEKMHTNWYDTPRIACFYRIPIAY